MGDRGEPTADTLAEGTGADDAVAAQELNTDRLADLLGLDTVERKLLICQLHRRRPVFSELFDLLSDLDRDGPTVLAAAFEVSRERIVTALSSSSSLIASGLLSARERPLRIDGPPAYLRATLTEPAQQEAELWARFVAPLKPPSAATGAHARLHGDDERILRGVLGLARPTDDRGSHVLLYGPRSLDKRDLLARVLCGTGIDGYEVVTEDVPSNELLTWVYIAQRQLRRAHPDAVLFVARAHDVLASRRDSTFDLLGIEAARAADGDEHDDEDDAAGLTGSRLRCVWSTDRAGRLSDRELNKFLFHCEALPVSRARRREQITRALADYGLSRRLQRRLTGYGLLDPRQLRRAVELADLLVPAQGVPARDGDRDRHAVLARERVIGRAVVQSQKALGREHGEAPRCESVTAYSLDYLNIAGRFTPRQIIEALRKRPHGVSLCFWGVPGAGKTLLAERIAAALDLPMLRRSASDLLAKWLGETEQRIAAMFAEAQAEGALLFLDEADSLLRDRTLARAEWSVTQVNELLQSMERFEGVFIAATNLIGSLDAAALRRFTWKLEFRPLTIAQTWELFCIETDFDPFVEPARAVGLSERLAAIDCLTPGDFATVKRQATMLGEQQLRLSPDLWLEQLRAEAAAKTLVRSRDERLCEPSPGDVPPPPAHPRLDRLDRHTSAERVCRR